MLIPLQYLACNMYALSDNSIGPEVVQLHITRQREKLQGCSKIATVMNEIQIYIWDQHNPKVNKLLIVLLFNWH